MSARPQQARAVVTRERLVEAAAGLLAREGLRGTTTAGVAAAAGVSQGALFKHFDTKTALLAAAAEAALAALIDDFRAQVGSHAGSTLPERLRAAIAALWGVFRRPAMQGLFELYLAARTDADLGAALAPLLTAHRARVHAEALRCLPELAGAAAAAPAAQAIDAVVFAMQGVAVGLFAGDQPSESDLLSFFERLARNELFAAEVSWTR
jgi:AcrR family transcriptional regulator